MTEPGEDVPNRALITGSIMLATILQSLDTTIANVALPQMQGSLQASQDQITWVLTSYIVAAAIMTPLTPWLSGRIGRKLVFLISVAGFTASSVLCGLAQNLVEMVGFRFLQGLFGAALVPLSQAVLLDINPPERHGRAMATWAMAAVLGPLVGPALGGWLTDNYSWRWVFLINLPGGILAFAGIWLFLTDHKRAQRQSFDFFGFFSLAVGITALQMMLDRGAGKDWFESAEIWIEFALCLVAFYLFIMHTLTARRPFFDRALARDSNFLAATVASFFIMSALFSVLALLPPMLEGLMGYPVLTTGLVTMPRGLGMFLTMFAVGRVIGRVDPRVMVAAGLLISAAALYAMSLFSLQMDSWPIIWTGFAQGVAIGLIFVPLSTIGFATLPSHLRTEASAVFNLVRNIGSAAGISVMQFMLASNAAKVHSNLVQHLTPDNPVMRHLPAPYSLTEPQGVAALNGLVTKQALMVAYISDYRMLAWATLAILPLVLILRKPRGQPTETNVILD